jgi:predicted tellurium resistance membrane protein TerC
VLEIHNALEGEGDGHGTPRPAHFIGTLVQIAIIDIVFSLDSVITAVGMVSDIPVMVLAIVIAVGIMMFAAKPIGDFVDSHPTIKMLALSFLILIGVALVGEGFAYHIPKGYIYFAMAVLRGCGNAEPPAAQAAATDEAPQGSRAGRCEARVEIVTRRRAYAPCLSRSAAVPA